MPEFSVSVIKTDITQPDNIDAVARYIERVLHAAYYKYACDALTSVEFFIMKDSLVLGIKSKSVKIKHYVYNRLFYELEKKFNLQFCPVYPSKETFYFLHDKRINVETEMKNFMDIYPLRDGFDPNFSVWLVTMFNKRYTIRLCGYKPLFEIGLTHINNMRDNGIAKFKAETWKEYNEVFEKVYGMKLINAFEKI